MVNVEEKPARLEILALGKTKLDRHAGASIQKELEDHPPLRLCHLETPDRVREPCLKALRRLPRKVEFKR
jgi:hypothetical protein